MPTRTPSYRYHKSRNCAVVTINGKDHYLGTYDSPESREKYHQLIAESLRGGQISRHAETKPLQAAVSVDGLILAYWGHVETYYVKDGAPTSEQANIRHALRFLRRLYGSTPATEFSPKRLKAVRETMIVHPVTRRTKQHDQGSGEEKWVDKVLAVGLTRKFINKQIGRIKRFFAWAVEEELVSVSIHHALLRVQPLKKGKSAAREKPRIRSVANDAVQKTLPLLRPAVHAMVLVQRLCGCRPQDVVLMRRVDINMVGPVWEYRPSRYKTEHRNDDDDPDLDRIVFLGPKAQEILNPWLDGDETDYLFSPRQSEHERNREKRAGRKTPQWPSHERSRKRLVSSRRRAEFNDHYDVAAYRRAIRRACEKAGITSWHPNQLRHARLTEIRRQFGLEASKACAGHREIGTTQHYAEQDLQMAFRVMGEVG